MATVGWRAPSALPHLTGRICAYRWTCQRERERRIGPACPGYRVSPARGPELGENRTRHPSGSPSDDPGERTTVQAFKTLGVIGAAVMDEIRPYGSAGPPIRSMGGIFYSLHALAALAPHPAFVVPALQLGSDASALIRSSLAGMGFDVRFLRPVPARQNRVELTYTTAETRREVLRGGVPALGIRDLTPLLREVDALYINFVAGNEITLPTLRRLRAAFGGPIYCDLHSLLLGRAREGVRYLRPLREWREWVACADIVQCNAAEAALLRDQKGFEAAAGDRSREAPADGGFPALDARAADRLGADVLALGVRLFILTDGPRPVRAWRAGGKPWRMKPAAVGAGADPTGCGDVLGAAFCALYFLRELPEREALARAVAAAGVAARRTGTDDLAAALSAWYVDHLE